METVRVFKQTAFVQRSINIPSYVFLVLMFFLTFIFSYVMAPFHVDGDQAHYIRAYAAVADLDLLEALAVYETIVHTAEPVHFLIIWIFSSIGVAKNVLMATANAILAVLFAKFLRQKTSNLLLILLITFSAYYLHTMFFTLERTKFAFIFMLLFLLTQRNWWLLLAVLTHSLMLIPLALNLIGQKLVEPRQKLRFNLLSWKWQKTVKGLVALALVLLIVNALGSHIYDKFLAYFNENLGNDSFEGFSLLVLLGLTLMTTQNKIIAVIFFLGLLFLAVLMGSSRINMIGYFTFLYLSNFQHQIFKFGFAIIGLYLLYKTWVYLQNIYYFGG